MGSGPRGRLAAIQDTDQLKQLDDTYTYYKYY